MLLDVHVDGCGYRSSYPVLCQSNRLLNLDDTRSKLQNYHPLDLSFLPKKKNPWVVHPLDGRAASSVGLLLLLC